MKRFVLLIIILLSLTVACIGVRIEQGDTSREISFIAVDSTDYITRETALSNTAVWYSVDGSSYAAMTTPTIAAANEINMPGVFWLSIDEEGMVTLPANIDEAELILHITADEMAPVSISCEIFRGFIDASGYVNLGYINDEATDGYNATLKLKMLDIYSNEGTAFSIRNGVGYPTFYISNESELPNAVAFRVNANNNIAVDIVSNNGMGMRVIGGDQALRLQSPVDAICVNGNVVGLNNLSQSEAQIAAETAIDSKFNLSSGIVEVNVKQLDGSALKQTGGVMHSYSVTTGDPDTGYAAASLSTQSSQHAILSAIINDTTELQEDWEDGGRLDLILDDIGSDVDDSNETLLAAINDVNITASDKTGCVLASDGLDYIDINDPNNTPLYWDFRDWLMWGVLEKASRMEMPVVNNLGEIKIFSKDGQSVITVQDVNECKSEYKRESILE